MSRNPTFGLGFGYDIAARFLSQYEMVGAEDFSARSPHSMVMSVFGRMGLAGLALWAVVSIGIARMTRHAFRTKDLDVIGLASVAWIFWICACFGVVLEGPMGAVVFWTTLGLANALTFQSPDTPAGNEVVLHPAKSEHVVSVLTTP